MFTLLEIKNKIDQAPTVMDLSEELSFMEQLMVLPLDEIKSNSKDFQAIIASLATSHYDTFYEVTEGTLPKLKKFSEWLVEVGREIPQNFSADAATFNCGPRE